MASFEDYRYKPAVKKRRFISNGNWIAGKE